MFKTIRNAWKLPELRRKLLFVIFALLIFRVGAAIPVPYINTEYLQDYIAANSGTIFGLLNTLSGSALSQATLFALSIQPYINASIIIQLLTIAIPALERLKLRLDHDNLELTGYDLEFGIQRSIEVESDCSGEFVILPRLLSEAVRRFSGDVVTMEVDDNYVVKLFCDATEFQISAMSSEEYPALPSLDLAAGMQIEQPVLNSMIRQTSYATSVSEAKPVLTGELFEVEGDTLHVAAIDGYRLAVRQEPISSAENYRFVVPKRTLLEVANMLHDDAEELCTISADRRHVVFEFNGYTVFSRLLEGEFHNYRSSIPSSFETEILLDTSELTRCLERCSLLISGKYNAPVRCTFSGGSLGVWCKTGIGEINDKIPADITGPDVTIGFDNRFLLDAVRAADCDKVKIQLSGGNRVAKLVPPQGESFTFLLMPIQLRN